MFWKFLPSRGGVRVGQPNPRHLVVTALESKGQITWKYQPVVVLDYQYLAQEPIAFFSQSALVIGNLESVLSSTLRIIVTILRSAQQKLFKFQFHWRCS